ncbi:MAG: hypothetical protein M0P47_12505 [Bacteroidales bacterium]|nr:hypothetical protein [Bacteroidales bacterium]
MDPSTLKQGKNDVTIKFSGVVDDKKENPVNIKLTISPAAPAYFLIPSNGRVKTISFPDDLDTNSKECTWNGVIEVPDKPTKRILCGLQLDATDVKGKNPSRDDFYFYISQ